MKLEDKIAQVIELDKQITSLGNVRNQLRSEIIQDLKMLSADSFATDKATVTLSIQERAKEIDIDRLVQDYDLSDCYELSTAKIKARADIPIKEYMTFATSEVLYVKAKKEKTNEASESVSSIAT